MRSAPLSTTVSCVSWIVRLTATAPIGTAAFRRDQHAGGARHWFDDHRGNRFRAVQCDDPLKLFDRMPASRRSSAREGVMLAAVRMRRMIDTSQPRVELLPVVDDAAHRNSAKADAVITALSPDKPGAGAFTARETRLFCVPIHRHRRVIFYRSINSIQQQSDALSR